MPITQTFDDQSDELIHASDLVTPLNGCPPVAIVMFDSATRDALGRISPLTNLTTLSYAAGGRTVEEFTDRGVRFAASLMPFGAPAAVIHLEELIALGMRAFVVLGSCGVLDAGIPAASLVVPTAAYRDEGTSYHYAPTADWIDVLTSGRLQGWLADLGVDFVAGKVWTTDAIYRETRTRCAEHAADGCVAVDMECAALAATAQFRGVDVYQFFYAADNLDADEWDQRTLRRLADEARLEHARLALEIAHRVAALD